MMERLWKVIDRLFDSINRLLDIIDRFSQIRPFFLIKRHAHNERVQSLLSTSILLQVTDRHLNVFLANAEYYKS